MSKEKDHDLLVNLLRKQNKKILFVGRFFEHKGQIQLLDVIERYMHFYNEKIHLNLVGKIENSILDKIKEKADSLLIAPYVKIFHNISADRLATFYRHSDIFVCMSKHESFGLPLLEAQSQRLPTLSLRRGAVPEAVGENQITVEEESPELFAILIKRILGDQKLKKKLVAQGLKNLENFSTQKQKRKILKFS